MGIRFLVFLFIYVEKIKTEAIPFVFIANNKTFDAPTMEITNTISSINIIKNNIELTLSTNFPFYNTLQSQGFGVNSVSLYPNRIDNTGPQIESIQFQFNRTIYMKEIILGAFKIDQRAILNYGQKLVFLYGANTNESINFSTKFILNPPIEIISNTILYLYPFDNSRFSLNSILIDDLNTITSDITQITTYSIVETTTTTTLESDNFVLNNEEESKESNIYPIIIGGCIGLFLLIILVILIIIFLFYRNRIKEKQIEDTSKIELNVNIQVNEIKDLEIGKLLGCGNYGEVYRGKWKFGDVAIKKISTRTEFKQENSHQISSVCDKFRLELLILTKLNHINIVRLFGTYKDYIVMEFIEYGSLDKFIIKYKYNFINRQYVDFYHIALQICNGMMYLKEKKIIHCDLAIRNILIDVKDTEDDYKIIAKISDFGLSKLTVSGMYVSSQSDQLPVRWCAPEVLQENKFSHESDIWSFGIVLWELFSLAEVPYRNLTNFQILGHILDGNRLQKPINCDDHLYNFMLNMWKINTYERTTLDEAFILLENIVQKNKERTDIVPFMFSQKSFPNIKSNSNSNSIYAYTSNKLPVYNTNEISSYNTNM